MAIEKYTTTSKNLKTRSIDYDDLLERGCLVLEIKEKNTSDIPLIPGSLYITEKELKEHLNTLSVAARPILITTDLSDVLRSVKRTLKSAKVEYYVGGSRQECYKKLKEHQFSWV